jgi:hypothetical protein
MMTGGDREIEWNPLCILPIQRNDPGSSNLHIEPMPKGITRGGRNEQLDAGIVVERRNDIQQPGQRGDVVAHEQNRM